jgi:Holliday junction DNA helicase RuvA
MIDFIKGKIEHVEPDSVVVGTAGGVGYRLYCANPYDFQTDSSKEELIYTYLSVREDAMVLFGFKTRSQQSFFRKLLDVNGVGPKMAIGMLAGATPEAIASAIQHEDVTALSRLPGVGKKTAQRMILDLKDKLDALGLVIPARTDESGKPATAPTKGVRSANWQEAKEALRALGFSDQEVDKALASLIGEPDMTADTPSDFVVKKALQILYRG